MHEDERHRNGGELTPRPAVAAPVENRERSCGEAVGDVSQANCADTYEEISRTAAKCCGGGASYCPVPKLCADAAAFDPAAAYEYRCYAMITTDFVEAYRFLFVQSADLWLQTFFWIDGSGRAGVCIDWRACFGAAWNPKMPLGRCLGAAWHSHVSIRQVTNTS